MVLNSSQNYSGFDTELICYLILRLNVRIYLNFSSYFSDIDECLKPKACGSNAFCTNSYGNYTCTCQEGFQGNPYDGVSTINW